MNFKINAYPSSPYTHNKTRKTEISFFFVTLKIKIYFWCIFLNKIRNVCWCQLWLKHYAQILSFCAVLLIFFPDIMLFFLFICFFIYFLNVFKNSIYFCGFHCFKKVGTDCTNSQNPKGKKKQINHWFIQYFKKTEQFPLIVQNLSLVDGKMV